MGKYLLLFEMILMKKNYLQNNNCFSIFIFYFIFLFFSKNKNNKSFLVILFKIPYSLAQLKAILFN